MSNLSQIFVLLIISKLLSEDSAELAVNVGITKVYIEGVMFMQSPVGQTGYVLD